MIGELVATARSERGGLGLILLLVLGIAVAVLATGRASGEAPQSAAAGTTPAARFSGADRAAIEAIVREYIMAHPEIIPEAINGLQAREVAKLLDANRAEIETPFGNAFAGNASGDVVLVEFFDYACPYCRTGHDDVQRLLAEDKQLKVVYRDFPVLSAASDEAAMASLSAAAQGKYRAFHDRMFAAGGKVATERTVATVRASGLDEARTARDLKSPALKAEIKKNLDLGRALGLTGTPSYVVGDQILNGAVGYDAIKAAVAEARRANARASASAG